MNSEEVYSIRTKLGETQEAFAKLSGVSVRTIQNWEAGSAIPKSKHAFLRNLLVIERQNDMVNEPPEVYEKNNMVQNLQIHHCFVAEDDAMNGGKLYDTPKNAMLFADEVERQDWAKEYKNAQYGWVIIHKKTTLFKDITKIDLKSGDITCSSRSGLPHHQDFVLKSKDVKQLFKVVKRSF